MWESEIYCFYRMCLTIINTMRILSYRKAKFTFTEYGQSGLNRLWKDDFELSSFRNRSYNTDSNCNGIVSSDLRVIWAEKVSLNIPWNWRAYLKKLCGIVIQLSNLTGDAIISLWGLFLAHWHRKGTRKPNISDIPKPMQSQHHISLRLGNLIWSQF